MTSPLNPCTMLDIIQRRESRRAFADTPVPPDVLEILFEAARWAPSCSNNQPWRFVPAVEPEALARVRDGLSRGNAWAKRAPVLVAVAANPADDANLNDRLYYLFDCGLAVENLLLQATACGLACHPMAGFHEDRVKTALGIPDDVRVITLIALGYPGNVEELDEATREKEQTPRTRKALEEIVFPNGWKGA